MSTLEDIGFRSFTSHDSVGAVATSSSDLWIGGALALGAVFGAVYAWPKKFRQADQSLWGDYDRDYSDVFVHDLKDAETLVSGGLLVENSPLEHEDFDLRARGFHPSGVRNIDQNFEYGHEDDVKAVVYSSGRPQLEMSEKLIERVLRGEVSAALRELEVQRKEIEDSMIGAPDTPENGARFYRQLQDNSSAQGELQKVEMLERNGFEPVAMTPHLTRHDDRATLEFVQTRCMHHRECREHPEFGRACLMAQWDERWKAGAK